MYHVTLTYRHTPFGVGKGLPWCQKHNEFSNTTIRQVTFYGHWCLNISYASRTIRGLPGTIICQGVRH
jgi:hypothetical protein